MVECTALEMRHTGNRIGGSNPSLSANRYLDLMQRPLLTTAQDRSLFPFRPNGGSAMGIIWTIIIGFVAGVSRNWSHQGPMSRAALF